MMTSESVVFWETGVKSSSLAPLKCKCTIDGRKLYASTESDLRGMVFQMNAFVANSGIICMVYRLDGDYRIVPVFDGETPEDRKLLSDIFKTVDNITAKEAMMMVRI